MDEIIVISPELKKLIDEVPVDLMRGGPERYATLRPSKRGSWRTVYVDGFPTALAWTDWENGFDFITIGETEITDRLRNYVIQCKALDIPASWAYTTLDKYVNRFDEVEVKLSEQQSGKLAEAERLASGGAEPELDEDETELEDDTED